MKVRNVGSIEGINEDTDLDRAARPIAELLDERPEFKVDGGLRTIVFIYDPRTNDGKLMFGNYDSDSDILLDIGAMPRAIEGLASNE